MTGSRTWIASRRSQHRGASFRFGILALACLCSGASCGHGGQHGDAVTPAHDAPSHVETLSSVDTSQLTAAEKRVWVDLVNDLLSPCGQPVSIGRCAADPHSTCHACVPAARFVARLITDGYERGDIEDRFQTRYGRDTRLTPRIDAAPSRGAPMGQITIVEFSDYECPYCRAAEPVLAAVMHEFAGKVKLVFLNYPLDQHPRAMPSARAAEAAANQGKFWEMHDLLFTNQEGALEDEDFERYAVQLGLDTTRFDADMASPAVQAKIDADKAEGRRLHVDGTPTMFIDGRRYREAPQALSAYLHEELDAM